MKSFKIFINYIIDIYKITTLTYLKIFFILFLVFCSTLIELLSLSLIIPFIGFLLSEEKNFFFEEWLNISSENYLILIASLFLLLIILRSLILIVINYFQVKYSNQIVVKLRSDILNAFFSKEYLNYKKKQISDFIYSLNDLSSRFGSIFINLIKAISDLIFATAILIYLSSVEFLFLIIFVLIAVFWLIIYDKIFGKLLKFYGEKFNYYIKNIISVGTESFTGFKEIVLLKCQNIFKFNLNDASKKLANNQLKHNLIYQLQIQFIEILTGAVILLAVVILFIAETNPTEIIGKLSVFAVGIFRLKPIVGTLNKAISDFRFNGDVLRILKNNLIIQNNVKVNNNFEFEINTKHTRIDKIEYKNIFFSYGNTKENNILKDINLKINDGDIIGIIGESGIGKTTLLDLISGLIIPDRGKILINDTEVNDIRKIKNLIGYITQDIFILDNDIKTNVAMEIIEGKINKEKINSSLLKAGLKEYINNYNKKVGEKGNLLSGGQKQRLVLARQFYRDNKILIFDESTNALDKKTEEMILYEIVNLKEKPIIILVSHSIDLKKYCNKIFKLENNKLKSLN